MSADPPLVAEMLVFARVVELRSFAAAARQLGLTTSAVSRSVGRLEAHWGVRLLHRTTRALSLTELGAEVYAGCAQLAHTARDVHAMAGHYRGTPRGTVRLSAPSVFGDCWLTARLPALRERWPEVELSVALSDHMVDLVRDGLDLAIRITRPHELPPNVVARPLCSVRYIAVASPGFLAGLGRVVDHPHQLADVLCITLGYGDFDRRLHWRRKEGALGEPEVAVDANVPVAFASSAGIVALALQHLGIGLVADFAAEAPLQAGALVPVLPQWALSGGHAPRTAYALYMPSRHVPLKVRAVVDHLAGVAAAPPSHAPSAPAVVPTPSR